MAFMKHGCGFELVKFLINALTIRSSPFSPALSDGTVDNQANTFEPSILRAVILQTTKSQQLRTLDKFPALPEDFEFLLKGPYLGDAAGGEFALFLFNSKSQIEQFKKRPDIDI